jgi:hypothetical protein
VCFYEIIYRKKPKKKECGILNLDNSSGSGTHWEVWYKKGDVKYYFDSYKAGTPIPYGQRRSQLRPGKHRGNENVHSFTEVGKFYENDGSTLLFIVTASKSRYLIMHIGCLHCIVFLFQIDS